MPALVWRCKFTARMWKKEKSKVAFSEVSTLRSVYENVLRVNARPNPLNILSLCANGTSVDNCLSLICLFTPTVRARQLWLDGVSMLITRCGSHFDPYSAYFRHKLDLTWAPVHFQDGRLYFCPFESHPGPSWVGFVRLLASLWVLQLPPAVPKTRTLG